MECRSEVARLMRQIDQEYEAAQRGLYGLAEGTSRHDFITQKMERIGAMNMRLIEIAEPEELKVFWFRQKEKSSSEKNT